MSSVFQDPERLRRKAEAAAIVRVWFQRRGSSCATCRALTELYMKSAAAIFCHNNPIEMNVRTEGADLVMMDAFGDDDPSFTRIFPKVNGQQYRSADGRCPDCGLAWRYEYHAHEGTQGVLRTVTGSV